jgi:gas vesicle protein
MAEEKNGMAKGLLVGFLAGAVAGAITALLYAPKSGKELRSDLKQKANSLKEDANDLLNVARSKTAETFQKGKARSEQFASHVSEEAEQILGDADKMISEIRGRATEESGKIKAAFRAGADAYKSEKRTNG